MKQKRLVAIVLCVVMMLSTTAVFAAAQSVTAYGQEDGCSISNASVGFERRGAKKAIMELTASSSMIEVEYIRATVTVQRKVGGSWTEYYEPYNVYGDEEVGAMSYAEIITVKHSGTYRLKVVFEDKKNGTTNTFATMYSYAASL